MHNHKKNSWMSWTMMACCVLPLLLIIGLGISGKLAGVSFSSVFIGVLAMATIHFIIINHNRK